MYYFIEVETLNSGEPAKAITSKTTKDSALMQLHQTFASAMANIDVVSCLCMIIDAQGTVYYSDYWSRPETNEV